MANPLRIAIIAGLLNVFASFIAFHVIPRLVEHDNILNNNGISERLRNHWDNLNTTTFIIASLASIAAILSQPKRKMIKN